MSFTISPRVSEIYSRRREEHMSFNSFVRGDGRLSTTGSDLYDYNYRDLGSKVEENVGNLSKLMVDIDRPDNDRYAVRTRLNQLGSELESFKREVGNLSTTNPALCSLNRTIVSEIGNLDRLYGEIDRYLDSAIRYSEEIVGGYNPMYVDENDSFSIQVRNLYNHIDYEMEAVNRAYRRIMSICERAYVKYAQIRSRKEYGFYAYAMAA